MNVHFRRYVRQGLNKALGTVGLELTKVAGTHQGYIDLRKTLSDAKASGLSLGDYIDTAFNVPGATDVTMGRLAALGIFNQEVERVCEIGPGSGRYLAKTIFICHPQYYEIYETAVSWRKWLARQYPVIAHDADGKTMKQTVSHSVNVVQAHKVFPGLKILDILNYFQEMIRVCRPEGYIVFDLLTESCFQPEMLQSWLQVDPYWPCALLPAAFVINYFRVHSAELIGRFSIPMMPGITDYFVFKYHHHM